MTGFFYLYYYMDMVITLAILAIASIVYNLTLPEIPESISATAYIENRKSWYFSIYSIGTGVLLLIPWIEATPETWQFLVFISCMGMIFAGTTPFFKSKFEAPIHYTSGAISIVTWIAWMLLVGNPWHLLICVVLYGVICAFNYKNWIYWAEVIPLTCTLILLLNIWIRNL